MQSSPFTPENIKATYGVQDQNSRDVSPYRDEPIGYSASLKKKDASLLKESFLPLLVEANPKERIQNESVTDPNSDSKKSHTFGRRTRLTNEGDSPDKKNMASSKLRLEPMGEAQVYDQYYQKDLIDKNIAENQKRLLYDKSLKAYYDPETGQYFEMK